MRTPVLERPRAPKVRSALTGLAAAGVAFLAGTSLLTGATSPTVQHQSLTTGNGGVDVVVRRVPSAAEVPGAPGRVDAATVERVRSVDGVASAAGTIEGRARLVRDDGSTAAPPGGDTTIGVAWIHDDALNPFELVEGRPPTAGEMVLDRGTAEREGWRVGDVVTVVGEREPVALSIVGVATSRDDGPPTRASLVAVSTATAQHLFAGPGMYDSVVVAGDGSVDAEGLASAIDAALGDAGLVISSGAADTVEQRQPATTSPTRSRRST